MNQSLYQNIHNIWKNSDVYDFVVANVQGDKKAAHKAMLDAAKQYVSRENIENNPNTVENLACCLFELEEERLADLIAAELSSFDEFIDYMKWLDKKEPKIADMLYQLDFINKIGAKLK